MAVTKRGVSFAKGGTGEAGFTASSVSYNSNRNIITEQAFGLGGEPYVYSGGAIHSGSIEGALRYSVQTILQDVNDVIAKGDNIDGKYGVLKVTDEHGGVQFASTVFNSVEVKMDAKDYARCTFNFFATSPSALTSDAAVPNYDKPMPIFYNAEVVGMRDISGFSVKLDVPIDQDYFVFGSTEIQGILQNGNGTVTGSLTFGAKEWATLQSAMFASGYIGTIRINVKTPNGDDMGFIKVDDVVAESSSFNGQGRQRFSKSINWRAPCKTDKNNQIFNLTDAT